MSLVLLFFSLQYYLPLAMTIMQSCLQMTYCQYVTFKETITAKLNR